MSRVGSGAWTTLGAVLADVKRSRWEVKVTSLLLDAAPDGITVDELSKCAPKPREVDEKYSDALRRAPGVAVLNQSEPGATAGSRVLIAVLASAAPAPLGAESDGTKAAARGIGTAALSGA